MKIPFNISRSDILKAIGSDKGLNELEKRVFFDFTLFYPIPIPKPGDWLYEHPEQGQTFEQYKKRVPFRLEAFEANK